VSLRSEPKTDDGTRTIALAEPLAEELWQHWRRTSYRGPDDRVFCHPQKGTPVAGGYYGAIMKTVLARAGVDRPMREYHDWRHTGITNAAAAGMSPMAIMQMAGHADFKTTERYIDLAKVVFQTRFASFPTGTAGLPVRR
jgi:integrase